GAGKTTIMKMMTGYLEPTSGSISVGGIDVVTDRLGVQRQIGYMPESAPLYREMLVQEYLMMMAELRGIPKDKRIDAVGDAVRATGLVPRLVQPIGQLSKGFRQRVGLASAILHRPDVLVLDEPTNGLDPVQILEIRELIRRLAETTTVIISTHILSEIEAVCHRVIILIDGHLAADESLDSLLTSNEIVCTLDAPIDEVERIAATVDSLGEIAVIAHQNGRTKYSIDSHNSADGTATLSRLAAEHNWTLYELRTEVPSLEQVFRRLMADHVSKTQGIEVQQ
ncbi:MAG: ATP-binding cassette domain-containing protein, partial [Pseudomonadota bacterium]|nr:ATP-binding cassette domain-containing protein [Pseudomonadota bacterium]